MSDIIHGLALGVLLAVVSLGAVFAERDRYERQVFSDKDTGCFYVGTDAGGYTPMVNRDGSLQCKAEGK